MNPAIHDPGVNNGSTRGSLVPIDFKTTAEAEGEVMAM